MDMYLCFSTFIRKLFPENISEKKRGKPTTASAKIKVFFCFPCAVCGHFVGSSVRMKSDFSVNPKNSNVFHP